MAQFPRVLCRVRDLRPRLDVEEWRRNRILEEMGSEPVVIYHRTEKTAEGISVTVKLNDDVIERLRKILDRDGGWTLPADWWKA